MMLENNFERLKTALYCEQPDRVPLCELLVDHRIKEAFLGKSFRPLVDLREEVSFWINAGYDYVPLFFAGYNFPGMKSGWAEEHKGAITNLEEFEKYPWHIPAENDYSILERVGEFLPSSIKIISGTAGIFERVWQLMGFETFCRKIYTEPILVSKMFEKVGSIVFDVYRKLSQYSIIGALWISDDIAYNSGPMVPPRIYRKYLFPWWKDIASLCQKHDLPLLLHSDGNLYTLIDELLEIGLNALHPIQPEAMDLAYLKKKYGGRLCLIGNVEVHKLSTADREDIRRIVAERLRIGAPRGGYCLGSSNTIAHYVKLENYIEMINACIEFGKYS
jgi:uroporphyrinogen decarboxylase